MNTLSLLRSGQLAGTTRLSLSCGLQEFPAEIYDLADSLEILNLSGNALSSLPHDLPRLHKLRVIFCSDNQFAEVPEVLGECAQLDMVGFKANRIRNLPAAALPKRLRWLILTDNQLPELPEQPGRLRFRERYARLSNYIQPILRAVRPARPASIGVFGGRLEYGRLKWWAVLFVMLIIQAPAGDRRNWEAIRTWAAGLPATLQLESPQTEGLPQFTGDT